MLVCDLLNIICWNCLLFISESVLCCIHKLIPSGRAVLWCVPNLNGATQALLHFIFFKIKLSLKNFYVEFGCLCLKGSRICHLILEFPVKLHMICLIDLLCMYLECVIFVKHTFVPNTYLNELFDWLIPKVTFFPFPTVSSFKL